MRILMVLSFSLIAGLAACTSTAPAPEISATKTTSVGCVGNTQWAYSAQRGSRVFSENCAYCHQKDGTGRVGKVPALANNAALSSDPDRGIRLLLITRSEQARTHGMEYDDMVAMLKELSENDLADALTYVLSSWGNCAGPIHAERIQAVAASVTD